MSVIVHGGTMDAQTIVTVPTPRDGQVLEALARYIPPRLVKQVLQRTGRSGSPMVLFWRGYIPLGRPVGDAKTVGLCV